MSIQTISSLPQPQPPQAKPNIVGASTPAAQRTSSDSHPTVASTVAAAATDGQKTNPVDAKELEAAVQKVQNFTQNVAKELQFDIDKDSGRTVVKVVDISTKEVIRQIPSEEMLAMAKALDQIQGLLVKQKA